ncbi:MAG: isoleucine--tRNA ligase [bacterium]
MNYSKTINLPRTEFPMKAGLSAKEPDRLQKWQEESLYEKIQEHREGEQSFVLHDGPPYANGDIHIGHALNKILKDILVKFKTMQGFRAPYRPGWDCHGLPIEHKVTTEDPQLKQEGIMAVRKACRDYSLKYVDIQKEQFKRLGVLGEWDNPYLTLTPDYEAEILRCFLRLSEDGYIYRQLKPVHWCYDCQTALAEAEVEYDSITSPSVYVDFEVIDDPDNILKTEQPSFMIWTTTPWTLPANVAIAVHPELDYVEFVDPEGKSHLMAEGLLAATVDRRQWSTADVEIVQKLKGEQLAGIVCSNPLIDERASRVVTGKLVTLEQGTGCVHIAPGHGQEDYELGLKYNLPIISPVDSSGKFSSEYPEYEGTHVLSADEKIIAELRETGALFHREDFEHSYPFCWRCSKPLLFRATPQWFFDVDHNDLRQRILESLDDIFWAPERGKDRFKAMVEDRPDWCLSRQRAWGVPIPALVCDDCGEAQLEKEVIERLIEEAEVNGVDAWFEADLEQFLPPDYSCPACGSENISRSRDILDVWFDSGVSHEAVLKKDQNLDWPADVYLEGSDQHRGWFQLSMIPAMGLEEAPPFKEIITHGFVVDKNGRKMSKSEGNVVSPQEVVSEAGADILRLWVASENYQEDLTISDELLDQIKTRYRRIRNTCKFFLGNLQDMEDFDPASDSVSVGRMLPVDRWFMDELFGLVHRVSRYFHDRQFHRAMAEINNFCAVEASSLYLDIVKDRLYCDDPDSLGRRSAQTAVYQGLVTLVKLVAPVLVFTADEVWEYLGEDKSVHFADWPHDIADWEEPQIAEDFGRLRKIREEVMKAIEEHPDVKDSNNASITLFWPPAEDLLLEYEQYLAEWFIAADVTVIRGAETKSVDVEQAKTEKCERCWRRREDVQPRDKYEGDLICERCYKVLVRGEDS